MTNYSFGLSLTGAGLYLLQLLPNIIWWLVPPVDNVLVKNTARKRIFNVGEQVFGIMTVALLIVLINRDAASNNTYLIMAALPLTGYYIAWILYYKGVRSPWLLVIGLAAMPPVYFLFVGLWMRNYLAVIACIIFGTIHIAITFSNYVHPHLPQAPHQ